MAGNEAVTRRGWRIALLGATMLLTARGLPLARAQEGPTAVLQAPPVDVVGTTPVLGTGIERERVPANVQVIGRDTIGQRPTQPLNGVLAQQLTSGSFTDTQGNPFNTTLNIRGYTASPVLGAPQAVAVYQNGVRVNDPFGDVVNWALIPSFAIDQVEVIPGTNPVFGLNALGGAVSLQLKDGFTAPGLQLGATADTRGLYGGTAEYGQSSGPFAVYGGVSAVHDDGWRNHSPSDVYLSYIDLAARGEKLDAGLSLGVGQADYTGNGGSPKQLLEENYRAIYTKPDDSNGRNVNLQGRASYALTDATSLQGNAYYRHTRVHTLNGDDFDAGGDDDDDDDDDEAEPLTDRAGNPIPDDLDINGALNETFTKSDGVGGSLQASDERRLLGLRNNFILGGSLDFGWTRYRTRSKAGELTASRGVDDFGFFLGGEDFNTKLQASNEYYGLYVQDTLALTQKLNATAAARLNVARIDLDDRAGSDLNGDHAYARVNPAFGLTYQWTPAVNTYVSYSEANRTPSAAEFSCADPERPCRVPNAFTADPDLDQVVSRTVEAGVRGRLAGASGGPTLNYALAAFGSWNEDDIIFVASGPVVGSGYFTNAGTTRRLGFEAGLDGRWRDLSWFLSYGFVRATFESSLTVSSPNNPKADDDGDVRVHSGDRLPGIPEHTVKLGAAYDLTDRWSIGSDGLFVSNRPYQGDEGNDIGNVPDYAIVNAETSYRLFEGVRATFRVENIFDRRYYTAGILGEPDEVFPGFTDQRFLTPGRPRTFELALALKF